MDKFIIKGPCKVKGQVNISGSKNASLPILAATLLFNKTVEIKNLPKVRDVDTMLDLIASIGFLVKRNYKNNSVKITRSKKIKTVMSYSKVKAMRAGILLLGPLISKFKKAECSLPGGCLIGPVRPVNFHLKALSKLGMKYNIKKGYIYANVKKNLVGNIIKFPKISVGATENTILASCLAKGKTVLKNCAIEPEIKDLTNFLIKAGAKIKWIGKRTVEIYGIESLKSISYSVMGDRIECGTFCVAAALTGGNLKINGLDPRIIQTELDILQKKGSIIRTSKNSILIKGPKRIKNIKKLVTKEWPGFSTDLQAQFMVLLCKARGRSVITENIFHNRFMHVNELKRLGAKIVVKNNKAIIEGNSAFDGAELMSSDLRASVALVLAAMVSKGTSIISRIFHLDRGYEQIETKLRKIGAKIRRIT